MKATTYPGADKSQNREKFGGITMSSINKVLLHTTESGGWPSYPDFSPTLTVDPIKKQIRQHMPISMSASTLANSGTYRTNRANVAQIEIVGYCDPTKKDSAYHKNKWGLAEKKFLAGILAWFHKEWGVLLVAPAKWPEYPSSYGNRLGQRFSTSGFTNFRGVCAHMHAPGNDHGDPGDIDIEEILSLAKGNTPVVVPPVTEKPDDDKETSVTHPKSAAPFNVNPVDKGVLGYAYGTKDSGYQAGYHTGQDWKCSNGDAWRAVEPGVVQKHPFNASGYGNYVTLQADNGRDYIYCHGSKITVADGQRVVPGQKIGEAGATGNTTGPHLHLEDRPRNGGYGNVRKPSWTNWDGKSYPGRVFVIGQSHPAVTLLGHRLQAHLGEKIYSTGPGPKFSETDQANVKKFQKSLGHAEDGWPGPSEWAILITDPKEPTVPEKPVDKPVTPSKPTPVPSKPPTSTKPSWSSKPIVTLKIPQIPGDVSYLQAVNKVIGGVVNGKKISDIYILAQDPGAQGNTRFLAFSINGTYINSMVVKGGGHGGTFHAYRSAAGTLYIWTLIGNTAYRISWQPGKTITTSSAGVKKMAYGSARPVGTYESYVGFRSATDTHETLSIHDRFGFTDPQNNSAKAIKKISISKRNNYTQQTLAVTTSRIYRFMGKTNQDAGKGSMKHILDVFDWGGHRLTTVDLTAMSVPTSSDEPEGLTFTGTPGSVLAGKREGGSKPNRSYPIWQLTGLP